MRLTDYQNSTKMENTLESAIKAIEAGKTATVQRPFIVLVQMRLLQKYEDIELLVSVKGRETSIKMKQATLKQASDGKAG